MNNKEKDTINRIKFKIAMIESGKNFYKKQEKEEKIRIYIYKKIAVASFILVLMLAGVVYANKPEVQEKIYYSSCIEYLQSKYSEDIKIIKAYVGNVNMILSAEIKNVQNNDVRIEIIDENGNIYYRENYFYGPNSNDTINTSFAINKNTATKKLFLKYYTKDEEKIIELIRGD